MKQQPTRSWIFLSLVLAIIWFCASPAFFTRSVSATQSPAGITITGFVFQGVAGDRSRPLAGYPVSLTADEKQSAVLTAEDGSFSFAEVALPAHHPVKLVVAPCEGCQADEPILNGGTVKPLALLPFEILFPHCSNTEACLYPAVEFFITQPEHSNNDRAQATLTAEATAENEKRQDAITGLFGLPVLDNVFTVPPASVVDVTAETGQFMTGPLTSWQTPDGPYNVEHLAGRNIYNDLITLYWSPRNGRWLAVNVTQTTGYKISGPVTSWQTPNGPYLVEHLAGRALNGDLIVFYWSPNAGGWRAVNVTQKTGQKIANAVTSWQTPNGSLNVEHLAGINPYGQLIVFWWSPAHDWQAVNVSQKTGVLVNSQVTDWQVSSNGLLTEYLAATNAGNELFVFSWSPAHDWQAVNVTRQNGVYFVGNVSSWMTGMVQHLAGQSTIGSLLTLWRSGAGNWNVVNVSQITGENVTGEPTIYQMADGAENVEILGSKNAQGQLIVSWWKPSRDWQALNLSEIAGQNIASAPTGWVTPNKVEHYAATTSASRLLVFYGYTKPRTLTDQLGREWLTMKRMRNIRRNVLTILWDPHRPGEAAPSRDEMVARIHGATNSVRGYFRENSNGAFTIQNAGVLGWYDADKPGDHYWNNANHNATYNDGWNDGHAEKWAEAIRKANNDFNFAAYDSNRDGTVTPNELAILIAIPQNGPFGTNRGVVGVQVPSTQPLVVDGVRIPIMAEWYTGNPVNFPVAAHELSHLLLNQGDLYFTFFNPFAAGDYSLMDQSYQKNHMDPLAKLKHGWVNPKIIFRSGRYSLKDVATGHGVWILLDPARGADEYFIIENRWKGTSQYEQNIDDEGLAVWRITEKQALIDILPPPPNVSAANWSGIGFGRRAIQLLRPYTDPTNAFGAIQLWDASTGYELQSVDANPTHTTLRWANGAPSGFALRALSAPGATMEATIQTP
jgi:M6 family metalloprotease-like protein